MSVRLIPLKIGTRYIPSDETMTTEVGDRPFASDVVVDEVTHTPPVTPDSGLGAESPSEGSI